MEIDEQTLRAIIREELANYKHPCRFTTVNDQDAEKMGSFLHSVSRIGGGSADDGFDIMRENNLWLKSMRESGGWAAKMFYGAVISAIVGAALMVLWEGFKKVVK